MKEVKLATICCFILALLDEVEEKGEEARHIRKKCQAFIDSHPHHLDIVANKAWEVACDTSEDYEVWSPAITIAMLWDKVGHELKDKAKLNPKYVAKLFNKQNCSVRAKVNSKKVANKCLQAINKVIYDNKGVIDE